MLKVPVQFRMSVCNRSNFIPVHNYQCKGSSSVTLIFVYIEHRETLQPMSNVKHTMSYFHTIRRLPWYTTMSLIDFYASQHAVVSLVACVPTPPSLLRWLLLLQMSCA